MAPPKGKAKRASPVTPLALYRRGLTAIKSWSPSNSTAADVEAISALTACCTALQAKLGVAAAAIPDAADAGGDAAAAVAATGNGSGSGAGAADAAAGVASVWPALEALERGMAAYGACVKHNLDLDLEDWEDEPGFLLACAHMELGKLLGRMCPPRGEQELAHLRAALALFPGFVAGRHALAQALLSRSDAQCDLDGAEALLRSCLATCRRLAAATGDEEEEGEGEEEEEAEGELGVGAGAGRGAEGRGGAGEAGEAGDGEGEKEGGLLLEANAACRKEWEAGAGVRRSLAMLLCQAGRDREAAPILRSLDFTHRLARPVLHYPLDPLLSTAAPATPAALPPAAAASGGPSPPYGHERYCAAVDGALPPALLRVLRAALAPGSRYWAQHGYGRVGYFSYMHELGSGAPHLSAVHDAAVLLQRLVAARFPAVQDAKYAEWWAHCRRHPSGHQLHFDSDDEGAGGVRNPIVSSVIYLTGEVGGPTLVTPQTLGGPLADRGWLIHPRENRLAMFDGAFLHGVIPGRGASPHPSQHRITLMVAFWRDIQCRPRTDGLPGPSQPFPGSLPSQPSQPATAAGPAPDAAVGGADGTAGRYTWMADLPPHPDGPGGWGDTNPVDALPTPIPRVWECVDGGGEAQPGAVQYDACFQGF